MTTESNQNSKRGVLATSTEDFIRFLSDKTKNTCPVCNEDKWNVLCAATGEDTYRFGMQVRNLDRRPYVSVFSAFCTNCGFMRSHLSRIVHEWVLQNPADQIELDLDDDNEADKQPNE